MHRFYEGLGFRPGIRIGCAAIRPAPSDDDHRACARFFAARIEHLTIDYCERIDSQRGRTAPTAAEALLPSHRLIRDLDAVL